ncbi:STN domain-containing protein, partial [bacterium]|nr:STN domain-containing protein [bacterium]
MLLLVSACAGIRTVDQSVGHLDDVEPEVSELEPIVDKPAAPPLPEPLPPVETYTVVVKDVPVKDLLCSLARDAGLDLDIQAESERSITINAVDQPLASILNRVVTQAGLRYVFSGNNLIIQEDLP